ncbi:MAG: hypothetical protein A2632_00395 [Candidatus Pacebacteria bacterium RIFCSPHIGHO2_01_FULL_46_16]|nr:MAG: hypothetical protein A2632_00395 [Candidatus Pacebacteria bacterium RIFCSPHIGHO2_01_FULL_46_16]OGJ21086.1 MAG: hypothetical protein A3J60_03705 [Candidatus Pacebacteria bacterium RIFCSPHIGHO2_02_FULL_46_9]OGJ38742.1 MAG: hypothetical protein A3A82_03380 [Candidatus Pacebacteria bacterium RIFCSPLOWO2_01_FULL_47_12]
MLVASAGVALRTDAAVLAKRVVSVAVIVVKMTAVVLIARRNKFLLITLGTKNPPKSGGFSIFNE